MSRTQKPTDDLAKTEDRERQEACNYIFDLLESLQSIAARHRLPVLAKFIQSAKSEAADYR